MPDFRVNAQIQVGKALYLQAWTIVTAEHEKGAIEQFEDEVRKHTASIIVLNAKPVGNTQGGTNE